MLLGMLSLWGNQGPSPTPPTPPAVIQAASSPFGITLGWGRPRKRPRRVEDQEEEELLALLGIDLD